MTSGAEKNYLPNSIMELPEVSFWKFLIIGIVLITYKFMYDHKKDHHINLLSGFTIVYMENLMSFPVQLALFLMRPKVHVSDLNKDLNMPKNVKSIIHHVSKKM